MTGHQRVPIYQKRKLDFTSAGSFSSVLSHCDPATCYNLEHDHDDAPTPLKFRKEDTPQLPVAKLSLYTPKPPFKIPYPSPALSSAGSSSSKSVIMLSAAQINGFVDFMLKDETIAKFLRYDYCRKLSDPYLLAMVFVYFQRLSLPWSRLDFFALLYLANDVEEDCEDERYEILPWALGSDWYPDFRSFYKRKNELFKMLDYRVLVARKVILKVFDLSGHPIWSKRSRIDHHSGAWRSYEKGMSNEDYFPKGPFKTPLRCTPCIEGLDLASLPTGLRPVVKFWKLPFRR